MYNFKVRNIRTPLIKEVKIVRYFHGNQGRLGTRHIIINQVFLSTHMHLHSPVNLRVLAQIRLQCEHPPPPPTWIVTRPTFIGELELSS